MSDSTAPDRDAETRQAITAALRAATANTLLAAELTEALMPVVGRLVAEGERWGAMEALETAADEFRVRFGWGGGWGKSLRDRAAALRAEETR